MYERMSGWGCTNVRMYEYMHDIMHGREDARSLRRLRLLLLLLPPLRLATNLFLCYRRLVEVFLGLDSSFCFFFWILKDGFPFKIWVAR